MKNKWMEHLKNEWDKEKKKKKPMSYSDLMSKAKKSYNK